MKRDNILITMAIQETRVERNFRESSAEYTWFLSAEEAYIGNTKQE